MRRNKMQHPVRGPRVSSTFYLLVRSRGCCAQEPGPYLNEKCPWMCDWTSKQSLVSVGWIERRESRFGPRRSQGKGNKLGRERVPKRKSFSAALSSGSGPHGENELSLRMTDILGRSFVFSGFCDYLARSDALTRPLNSLQQWSAVRAQQFRALLCTAGTTIEQQHLLSLCLLCKANISAVLLRSVRWIQSPIYRRSDLLFNSEFYVYINELTRFFNVVA